jgi:hypothetical protein
MKKTFQAFWLALFGVVWLVLLASSCHETPTPEPQPPAFNDQFACYINGKFWQAYQPPSGAIITWKTGKVWVLFDPDPQTGYIWIQAYRDTLKEKEALTVGTKYGIGNGSIGRHQASSMDADLKDCSILTDTIPDSNNWIEIISIDTSKRIVAGKFEGKPKYNSCKDKSGITNGSFEVKY